MTARGAATRSRLLEATRAVVRETGYRHATTRAIAARAGVAEGTIYRHFPDKVALFFAAVLEAHQPVVDALASLPALAGTGTVAANLATALRRLLVLREDVVPLELAIAADPDLAGRRAAVLAGAAMAPAGGPPEMVAAYLAAEQRLGRVRADVDPWQITRVLLSAVFGLGVGPAPADDPGDAISLLARIVVEGIGSGSDGSARA